MFEKETDERTKQYMNEHTEKYNCESTKIETDNYNAGLEQGYEEGFQDGANFVYNKINEWHNLNENSNDLPNEGEWVEGLYIWYYKGEPKWDVFKVRWFYEIGELDEKISSLVR